MTYRAGSLPPQVMTASPVGKPFGKRVRRISLHSARICGPPERCIAPSTPPPAISDELAAFTIASTFCCEMSPTRMMTLPSQNDCGSTDILLPLVQKNRYGDGNESHNIL